MNEFYHNHSDISFASSPWGLATVIVLMIVAIIGVGMLLLGRTED